MLSSDLPVWLTALWIAHRGLFQHPDVPENSLVAFKKAIAAGLAFECDVQLSKDGHVMVFHDTNLRRMTGKDADIHEVTAATMDQLTLLETKEKIPTLQDLLDLVDGKVPIHLEIKQERGVGPLEEKVLAHLKNYKGPVVILSFNKKTLRWFKKHAPNYPRVFNYYGGGNVFALLWKIGRFVRGIKPTMVNLNAAQITPAQMKLISKVWPVNVYGVYDQETYDQFKGSVTSVIFENINQF